ncbi:MAG: LysR family transcriptional regulator [Clostridiales bacterium]|jgi:DNA-binding transcriptional LysR family regulator|nr:LysR family transcriptional regulator [Eubacteriales bacterium]MDH7566641.1 LysR family transcriptional regulator [Clostridiales bacterium]
MLDSKLTTFIQVAKLKSFTKAADTLNLTQPAVTQHIKQLEEFYGVRLIKKNGRQISLTEEGELLLQHAKEFEAKEVLLERKLRNKSALVKRYTIGATLTIGEYVLPYFLGEHKRLYNSIDIVMQVNNSEVILKKLISGEIDLGVIEGPFDKSRFQYKKLKEDELVLVCSPLDSFVKCSKVGIGDIIKRGKLILREKGSGTRMVFENKLVALGHNLSDVKVYMEVGSIGAIKSLVEANLGYTVISREAVKREVEAGSLVIIPMDGVRIMREFNFIYSDHGPKDFIVGFMDFVVNQGAVI